MAAYVLSIDQSTQGTKALLFDSKSVLVCRADRPHKQIVNELGWVEHDPEEIWRNTLCVVRDVVEKARIDRGEIQALGISNQRETGVVWERDTGKPVCNAVVWQCARGAAICDELEQKGAAETVRERTGLKLSPYFTAAKWAWILQNVPSAREKAEAGGLCCGTVDSFLVYRLTKERRFQTDCSNASRTQLFNIRTLQWDEELCALFGVPIGTLPQVTDSNGDYGKTDFDGYLPSPIPIRAVMGDSHGALFGQGCLRKGMAKVTYGTGSSVMMNTGETPYFSGRVVTSLAWRIDGKVDYVLEGNINYTGAVVTWLKDDLGLIASPGETQALAESADPQDTTYLVPAFSGLGPPHWDIGAKAAIVGMTRTTRKAELVKAAVESIAYQIADVVSAMQTDSGLALEELRADGGPSKNCYLMQFQSDITALPVRVSPTEELSGMGAALLAGLTAGLYDPKELFHAEGYTSFLPQMKDDRRNEKLSGWRRAVANVLTRTDHYNETCGS